MLVTCNICKKEFLTEADPHAFVLENGRWVDNCGCYFAKRDLEDNKKLWALIQELKSAFNAIVTIRPLTGEAREISNWANGVVIVAKQMIKKIEGE
jgi:hypothetical protein